MTGKISEDTAVSSLDGSESVAIVQSGENRRATVASLVGGRFLGALVKKAADQTTADYSAGAVVAWDSEIYDNGSWHDTSTNNSRLSVPSTVSYVRVGARLSISNLTADMFVRLTIRKNGSGGYDGSASTVQESGDTQAQVTCWSPIIPVIGGTDYFEAFLFIETDNSVTIVATGSWFAIEAA